MKTATIKELEQNVHEVTFGDGRKLYLIGTAHVSQQSVDLVEKIIGSQNPDTIAIELDEKRFTAMTERRRYENMDIAEVIKKKQLLFVIAQFLLASFQKRMADKSGTKPGDEFRKAAELAKANDLKLVLADRSLETTLKRAWGLTGFVSRMKLIGALLFSDKAEVAPEDIEKLKQSTAIDEMVNMFASQLPEAKTVLIDERDAFLSYEILNNLGERTVAVVGAGHVNGILKRFESPVSETERAEIDVIPPKSIFGMLLPWVIPFVLLLVFALGFIFGNREVALDVAVFWVVANGTLAALGCILAFGHPLTAVSGFIAAPITSLNPTIGAGFVTALVQALLVKPRVADVEQLQSGTMTIRQWWKNRLTKVFLVFIFSAIGSSIGTFIAAPYLVKFFNG